MKLVRPIKVIEKPNKKQPNFLRPWKVDIYDGSGLRKDIPKNVLQKRGRLDYNYNKYGYSRVAHLEKKGKCQVCYDVWYDWLDARDNLHLVQYCNQRTIYRCELVLDIDESTIKESKIKLKEIQKDLDKKSIEYKVYSTGSRGYHVHIIDPQLANYHWWDREKIRKSIIKKFNVDEAKKSDKVMIAMENVPHWKSGIEKQEVYT